ncbi:MAG: hypothetical protein AAF628_33010 [Planctomycetota bacterium]
MSKKSLTRALQQLAKGAVVVGALAIHGGAQVPAGWIVTANPPYRTAGCCGGLGGVRLTDPIHGTSLALVGLSGDLSGRQIPSSPGELGAGVDGILLRERDQALVCGKTVVGGPLELHVLQLTGTTVTAEQVVPLSLPTPSSGRVTPVFEVAPDAILVDIDWVDAAGVSLPLQAIVNLATGQMSILPLPPRIAAIAATPDGDEVWVALPAAPGAGEVNLFAVPLSGAAPRLVTQVEGFGAMAIHPNGRVYMADLWSFASEVRELDPLTGAVRTTSSVSFATNNVAFDPATGDLLVTTVPVGFSGSELLRVDVATGAQQMLLRSQTRWLQLRANPRPYGVDSPAANRYRWAPWASPSGLPRLGTAYEMRLDTTPAGAPGVLLVAAARAPSTVRFEGIELVLDPFAFFAVGGMPATGRRTLPMPSAPALAGQTVFFQTVHVDAGGLGASNGLEVTIML